MSIKEVDNLLSLLAERKRKMEQEEAERNMQILLDFLHCLRKQKVDELNEVGLSDYRVALSYLLIIILVALHSGSFKIFPGYICCKRKKQIVKEGSHKTCFDQKYIQLYMRHNP